MEDRRQDERTPYEEKINYSVSVLDFREIKNLNLEADSVDLSKIGLGIETAYPLEPGHVIRFNNGIGQKIGVVRWSVAVEDKHTHRVGIKFI